MIAPIFLLDHVVATPGALTALVVTGKLPDTPPARRPGRHPVHSRGREPRRERHGWRILSSYPVDSRVALGQVVPGGAGAQNPRIPLRTSLKARKGLPRPSTRRKELGISGSSTSHCSLVRSMLLLVSTN